MEKRKISIQEYLSLGYLYLLVIGILSESLYYNFVGIHILSYSSFLDVLISPINLLTNNLVVPAALLFVIGGSYLFLKYLIPKLQKEKHETQKVESGKILIVAAFSVVSMFLGLGLGRGTKLKENLESGQTKPTHYIQFISGEVKAKIIGQNSLYIFYIPEGQKKVIISPIECNVKLISKLPSENSGS